MCYFPTGATLRMCLSHVSGNDREKRKMAGEVDLADKGQTSQRKLEINGSAGYTPCAHKQAHTHTLRKTHDAGVSC